MYTSLAIGATLVGSLYLLGVLGGIFALYEDLTTEPTRPRFDLPGWLWVVIVASASCALAVWLWQKAVA